MIWSMSSLCKCSKTGSMQSSKKVKLCGECGVSTEVSVNQHCPLKIVRMDINVKRRLVLFAKLSKYATSF
jgi:hypothetical protein